MPAAPSRREASDSPRSRAWALDTAPEVVRPLTRLAVKIFDVPSAAISLIDRERQWFKSRQGLEVCETPRGVSFCSHGILSDTALVVPDATLDPRFSDSPLVTGETGIRFYAGWPLKARDGLRIGMFCVMDRRPRQLANDELAALQDLAMLAEDELGGARLSLAYAALGEQEAELADFFENAGDLILRTDLRTASPCQPRLPGGPGPYGRGPRPGHPDLFRHQSRPAAGQFSRARWRDCE